MITVTSQACRIRHGEAIRLADIPSVDMHAFRTCICEEIANGAELAALFGVPSGGKQVRLYAVLASPDENLLALLTTDVEGRYPALTPDCPRAHWFEREIAEQWGVVPEGHPWLKPIRFHASYRRGHDAWNRATGSAIACSVTDFFRVDGEEVHEVAVGPVHAGVIEPGHFRFQCHGEQVFHLEISLGFQHRGVERSLIGGPNKRTIHTMETMAGDTSVGHATAYCHALESLAQCQVPLRAQAVRGIALELERMANHTGDLGALAGDVGFLPSMAYCGRLRGDFLNASALVCGSRFGRSLVRPGGVVFDIDPDRAKTMTTRLAAALRDVDGAAQLMWDSRSVLARFEDTGRVPRDVAAALGLVGLAGRASGLNRDVRRDFPSDIYRFEQIEPWVGTTGDVQARAEARWREIQRSGQFVLGQLESLPASDLSAKIGPLAADSLTVALVEGWRGEICHVAITDSQGSFAHYKVVDPSFHNWIGLGMSLRDQQISDFPLCNKSFNLSYCGHDL